MVCIDWPKNVLRFQIIYPFSSLCFSKSIDVITFTNEVLPLKSVTSLYESANWSEREIWDLFGIYFDQHPNLVRILTDYGFKWNPLRKDYPLVGFEEIYFSQKTNLLEVKASQISISH